MNQVQALDKLLSVTIQNFLKNQCVAYLDTVATEETPSTNEPELEQVQARYEVVMCALNALVDFVNSDLKAEEIPQEWAALRGQFEELLCSVGDSWLKSKGYTIPEDGDQPYKA